MRTRNRLIRMFIATAGAGILLMLWSTTQTSAIVGPEYRTAVLSPVSITHGQTLQLHVANISSFSAFNVVAEIVDDNGDCVRCQKVRLGPRQMLTLSIDRADIPGHAAGRVTLTSQIKLFQEENEKPIDLNNPLKPTPEILFPVLSEEVYDNATGATTIYHPGLIKGFNPQPDPPVEGVTEIVR